MLHINIICVGKLKEKYLQDALAEYSKRLSKYCNLNIIELPDEKLPNNLNDSLIKQIKSKESNNILSHIEKGSYVLALDLKGKQYSSEEFSQKITNISLNRKPYQASPKEHLYHCVRNVRKLLSACKSVF